MLAIGGIGAVIACGDVRADHPAADDQQQLGEEDRADQRADRQVLQEALPQLGEIDVEHHHHEQEQHRAPRRHRPRPGSSPGTPRPSARTAPDALTKARMRNSTECTGFFAAMTMTAEATHTPAKR